MMKIKRHGDDSFWPLGFRHFSKYYEKLSSEDLVDFLPCGCQREPGEFSIDEIYDLARAGDEEAKQLVLDFEGAGDGEFGSLVDADGKRSRLPSI